MGRWLETYQSPEEVLMTKFKTITTTLLANYQAENPEFHYDFDGFVKELLTDEPSVARVFDMLIRDVYKRTRRQSRASSQDPSSTTSPASGRGLPVPPTGAAADPARLARFLQLHQHSPYYQPMRSSSHPRQTPASDGENVRESRDYRLIREISEARQARRAGQLQDQLQDEDINWVHMTADSRTQVSIPAPETAREEDKDEETVVENRDLGLGTVVV